MSKVTFEPADHNPDGKFICAIRLHRAKTQVFEGLTRHDLEVLIQNAKDALRLYGQPKPLECKGELLMAKIQEENASDDESWDKSGNQLLDTYNNSNEDVRRGMDVALMSFTGWQLPSLVARTKGEDVNNV